MTEKKSSSRAIEIDIVRLHHATGRQRDELVAKLIYELITGRQQSQAMKKRRLSKRRPPTEELDL